MKKKNINSLLEPDNAVETYLDTLLQESTEHEVPSKLLKNKSRVVLLPELDLSKVDDAVDEITPGDEVTTEPVSQPQILEEHTTETDLETDLKAEKQNIECEPKEKHYDFPMQCLMFWVGDSQLSIPLIDLGSVLPWVDNMTQLPQVPEWFLGLLKHRDSNVKVADTAKLLETPSSTIAGRHSHILVLADGLWAISCDQIGDVISLNPEDIQWNNQHGNKLLAIGTIKQSLAQLLDPEQIRKRLSTAVDSN